jgi:uncharacterized protein
MTQLNIRRLVLDVDKALRAPSLLEIAVSIHKCHGVPGCNVTVMEVDIETVGTNITIEGTGMNYDEILRAIETTGAVVHSLDQLVTGDRIVEDIARVR